MFIRDLQMNENLLVANVACVLGTGRQWMRAIWNSNSYVSEMFGFRILSFRKVPVENGITHSCGTISNYTEWLQVTMIGIVRVGNEYVAHIVQITIEIAIDRQLRWFHNVTQQIDAAHFVQRDAIARNL